MRIVCLPLDDRPLNYAALLRCTAVSPVEIILPPRDLIGTRESAPELFPVARWMLSNADNSALVISLDAMLYGGLVQARAAKPNVPRPQEALKLLKPLARLSASARAFLVWKRVWGNIFTTRGLARMPAFQRASLLLAELAEDTDVEKLYARLAANPIAIGDLPADDVAVLARSRLHSLAEGKAVVRACADAGISLHIAIEDSVQGGVQEAELRWLQTAVPSAAFTVADGADEAGAVLTAGAVAEISLMPQIRVCSATSLDTVAPYESRNIAHNLSILCGHARAQITKNSDEALVHLAGEPEAEDTFALLVAGKLPAVNTAELLSATVASSSFQDSITCELTATNGINSTLLASFASELNPPLALVQMNTVSNRIGHALLLATVTANAPASDALARLVIANYLEDLLYQAHLRTYIINKFGGIEPESKAICAEAESELSALAEAFAKRKFNGALLRGKRLKVIKVRARLPWSRWFEAEFEVEAAIE
jgi:hypothetical protein